MENAKGGRKERTLEEGETSPGSRASEDVPGKKETAWQWDPSFPPFPFQGAYLQRALDQEPTETSPKTWKASYMFVLGFPVKTNVPQCRNTGLISLLRQTWSPNRMNLWKFPPGDWELVHFRTNRKWVYIIRKK